MAAFGDDPENCGWDGGVKVTRVEVASSHDFCGYEFKEGKRYLIYAYGEAKDPYSVTYCSRTQPIENAEEDLRFLRVERLKLNARISLNLIPDAQSYYSLPKEKRDLPK
jgi:hypothetical protein